MGKGNKRGFPATTAKSLSKQPSALSQEQLQPPLTWAGWPSFHLGCMTNNYGINILKSLPLQGRTVFFSLPLLQPTLTLPHFPSLPISLNFTSLTITAEGAEPRVGHVLQAPWPLTHPKQHQRHWAFFTCAWEGSASLICTQLVILAKAEPGLVEMKRKQKLILQSWKVWYRNGQVHKSNSAWTRVR